MRVTLEMEATYRVDQEGRGGSPPVYLGIFKFYLNYP